MLTSTLEGKPVPCDAAVMSSHEKNAESPMNAAGRWERKIAFVLHDPLDGMPHEFALTVET